MEGFLKHMTRLTAKINRATIFTKNAIQLIIVPIRGRKRMMVMKISSPVNKLILVLKTCTNMWRSIRRPLPPYKLTNQILKSKNPTYQTHIESHTQIHFFCWRTSTRVWNLKRIQPNRFFSSTKKIDSFTITSTWVNWSSLTTSLPWIYSATRIFWGT